MWIETEQAVKVRELYTPSRPTRACGLKLNKPLRLENFTLVTPHTGVWIETLIELKGKLKLMSRPTRACGLKQQPHITFSDSTTVTPHTGVWIETPYLQRGDTLTLVTPHTGVWIETLFIPNLITRLLVTPHTGVWIETMTLYCCKAIGYRHAPHGRVD